HTCSPFFYHIMPVSTFFLFFLYGYVAHRDLHSFPTRRTSDLSSACPRAESSWCKALARMPGSWTLATASSRRSRSNRTTIRDERSEEHTSELQSPYDLVCRLLLEKKKKKK